MDELLAAVRIEVGWHEACALGCLRRALREHGDDRVGLLDDALQHIRAADRVLN